MVTAIVGPNGSGMYRIETERAEQDEAELRANGFQVLENRRLELEDILRCMILKEEATHEPA
ncbi:MAG: hypothetical protein JWR03_458 [Cohnella sp.]|nr:hypothetical protein [Cohnella sp.]